MRMPTEDDIARYPWLADMPGVLVADGLPIVIDVNASSIHVLRAVAERHRSLRTPFPAEALEAD